MGNFRMPQHVVDQHAAALRDSGLPNPVVKVVASSIAMTFGQVADSLRALDGLGVTLTPAQVAEMLADFKDTL